MEARIPDVEDLYQGVVAIKEAHTLMKHGGLSVKEFNQIKKATLFKMVYKTSSQKDFEEDENPEELNKKLAKESL